jgi:hypothetical protein
MMSSFNSLFEEMVISDLLLILKIALLFEFICGDSVGLRLVSLEPW